MIKKSLLFVLSFVCFFSFSTAVVMSDELRTSPGVRYFNIKHVTEITDEVTGERKGLAWVEYNSNLRFDIELETGIQSIRVLRLSNPGSFSSVYQRLNNIRERMEYAMDRLSIDSYPVLTIEKQGFADKVDILVYCLPIQRNPGSVINGYFPIRIMTVTEKDANDFAFLDQPGEFTERSPVALASYLASQIEAHFVLFIEKARDYEAYEKLAADNVISGKIYRELYIRGNDVTRLTNREFDSTIIKDALDRIPMYQRTRLQTMSQIVPRDWDKTIRGENYFKVRQ